MKIKNINLKFFLLSLVTFVTISCTSYLENPLIDKETGEYIDLLVIDSSVFPVRLKIHLVDSLALSAVVSKVTISFSGKNDNDIITLSGKKQSEFHTSSGFLELAIDPNIIVSETEPLSFTMHIVSEGYTETLKEFIFYNQGVKEITVHLKE
jgi:hypothetical protein